MMTLIMTPESMSILSAQDIADSPMSLHTCASTRKIPSPFSTWDARVLLVNFNRP